MLTGETYRAKALECLGAAKKVRDLAERVALLTMACGYLELAGSCRHDYGTAHRGIADQRMPKDS